MTAMPWGCIAYGSVGYAAVTDVPSRLVRAEAHDALNLHCAHALLGGQHQMDNLEPVAQVDLGVFKNGTDKVRKAVSAALTAIRAFPLKFHGLERIDVLGATAGANNALWPTVRHQIAVASLFIWEKFLKSRAGQLVGFLSHSRSPILEAA